MINGQPLYFGLEISEEYSKSYGLPPKPPLGAFDVRFSGDLKQSASGGVVEMMASAPVVTISYKVIEGEEWRMIEESRDLEILLQGKGEAEIPGDVTLFRLERVMTDLPNQFFLKQNHPNPFNPVTEIRYVIPEEGLVNLKIFNVLGEEVASLVNENQSQGNHTVIFNAEFLSSGVYIYRLEMGGNSSVKKCIILK